MRVKTVRRARTTVGVDRSARARRGSVRPMEGRAEGAAARRAAARNGSPGSRANRAAREVRESSGLSLSPPLPVSRDAGSPRRRALSRQGPDERGVRVSWSTCREPQGAGAWERRSPKVSPAGREHGADHPADEPGLEVRNLGAHAAMSRPPAARCAGRRSASRAASRYSRFRSAPRRPQRVARPFCPTSSAIGRAAVGRDRAVRRLVGRTVLRPQARATRPRGVDAWLDAPRGGNDLGRSAVRRIHRPRTGHVLVAAPAGLLRGFLSALGQEAVIRSETAFFSSAVIGRRFLVGLASDAVSATGVAAAAARREEERRAAGFAGAEVPSILSTSFNALISPCKRSISLWRSAIAFAMTLIKFFPGAVSSVARRALGSGSGRVPMGCDSRHSNPDGLTVTPGARVCGAG